MENILITTSRKYSPVHLPYWLYFKLQPLSAPCLLYLHTNSFISPQHLYWLPIAAATNYHKIRSLKWHKSFCLQFWKSGVWNQSHQAEIKVQAALCSLGRLSERMGSLTFPGCSWLPAFFGPLVRISLTSASIITSLSLWLSRFFLIRTLGLHWAHLDNPGYSQAPLKICHLVTSAKFLLPYKVIFSQVTGISMCASLGTIIQATHRHLTRYVFHTSVCCLWEHNRRRIQKSCSLLVFRYLPWA